MMFAKQVLEKLKALLNTNIAEDVYRTLIKRFIDYETKEFS
jgi:hypothetical protein